MRALSIIVGVAAALAFAAFVAGCITSGGHMQEVGPGVYNLGVGTYQGWFGSSAKEARESAIAQAGDYCRQQGKQVLVTTTAADATGRYAEFGSANITFRCLSPGEAATQRPEAPANAVIEQRSR